MAYRAVNAPTSTHFTCFLNNYECFSAGGCGQPSESAGVSQRVLMFHFPEASEMPNLLPLITAAWSDDSESR